MNSSGKVLTIFLVIIATLLISLTAISIFFFQKEIERRKMVEAVLERTRANETELEADLKQARKEIFLLEEKNKEADERINDLSDELELETSLREEMKIENLNLKDQIDQLASERNKIEAQYKTQIESAKTDMESLQQKINQANTKYAELEKRNKEFEEQNAILMSKVEELEQSVRESKLVQIIPANKESPDLTLDQAKANIQKEVELEEIVVVPTDIPEGRLLSIDQETEFVIINLGQKDGLQLGQIFSVVRGEEYLGDIKITRLQPEMAAADLIPPFSSRAARKNDKVVVKQ
ncbi:MAG: hypothetical protein KC713_02950 [Candidatus Omnitrophica bacterium]|nr:hypothetical protein [Candidatus Omnitrophota bacterium]